MACAICPGGCGTVWIGKYAGDDPSAALTWSRLVHVDSWGMTPNRQEATKKRTSDTGGAAIKFCSDIIDWTVTVTNTLCIDDWLYSDILADQENPSVGTTAWFFLSWDCDFSPLANPGPIATPATTHATGAAIVAGGHLLGGIFVHGTVSPPGFSIDNNSTDPATGEWNVDITLGPYLPADNPATAGTGSYSISDGDPTNTEAE